MRVDERSCVWSPPPRRWQFSTRGLLGAVTLLAVAFAALVGSMGKLMQAVAVIAIVVPVLFGIHVVAAFVILLAVYALVIGIWAIVAVARKALSRIR